MNSNQVVQEMVTMVNYLQPESVSFVDKVKVPSSQRSRLSSTKFNTLAQDTAKSIGSNSKIGFDNRRLTSTLEQQEGYSIYATENQLKTEMIDTK